MLLRLDNREISYWNVLGPDSQVSQRKLLICLNWYSLSGTANSRVILASAPAQLNLVGHHLEPHKLGGPEGRGYRSVGGVAPACHHNAPDAWPIVAGIHREPARINK